MARIVFFFFCCCCCWFLWFLLKGKISFFIQVLASLAYFPFRLAFVLRNDQNEGKENEREWKRMKENEREREREKKKKKKKKMESGRTGSQPTRKREKKKKKKKKGEKKGKREREGGIRKRKTDRRDEKEKQTKQKNNTTTFSFLVSHFPLLPRCGSHTSTPYDVSYHYIIKNHSQPLRWIHLANDSVSMLNRSYRCFLGVS